MKVIISMAGNGSRFKQAGINEEKYKLQIKEQTMFEYALESIHAFFDYEFVFITRKDHEARTFISEKCTDLGIEKFEIVELDELTSGQATTALKAAPYVDADDAVVIYNIDTYVANGHLSPRALDGDGCIPVFETEGGSWSFVEVNESGQATEVAEKTPISDLASLGLYHFDRFELFISAFDAVGKQVEAEYGERYIAPLYNWLIDQGYNVTIQTVPRSDIHILGTPDDVLEFDPEFATRYSL
jgi:dTDP-glucose pyrophosphorylase